MDGDGEGDWLDRRGVGGRPTRRGRASDPPLGPVSTETYIAASLGPPRWVERLQDIEAEEFHVRSALRRTWLDLGAAAAGSEAFAATWRARAQAFDLTALNRLIAQHNEYFPIERRLPFDPRTGDYRAPWGIPWRRQARDTSWILDEFPADLAATVADRDSGDPREAVRPSSER